MKASAKQEASAARKSGENEGAKSLETWWWCFQPQSTWIKKNKTAEDAKSARFVGLVGKKMIRGRHTWK